jgi:hypothetical protein
MAFAGFERDRETLKYRCTVRSGVRIPLKVDRRIFTPVARSSYRWQRLYKRRSALERINSRIDTSFGFERHTTRGLTKMLMMVTISLSLMLAIAVGRTREQRPELIRSMARAG